MGFNRNGTKAMLYARKCGVSFRRVALLGRQELHVTAPTLRNLGDFGYKVSSRDADRMILDNDGYAEGFSGFWDQKRFIPSMLPVLRMQPRYMISTFRLHQNGMAISTA